MPQIVCGSIAENAALGARRVSAEFKPDHRLAARGAGNVA